jgi:hypothetical protein
VCEYVDKLRTGLRLAFQQASSRNKFTAAKQKERYDKRARKSDFDIGDLVYVNRSEPSEGLTPKLQPRWMGPYLVCLIMGDELMVQPEGERGKTLWIHKNQCKPFQRLKPEAVEQTESWPEPSGREDSQQEDGDSHKNPHQPAVNSPSEDESDSESESEEGPREEYNLRPRQPIYYGK